MAADPANFSYVSVGKARETGRKAAAVASLREIPLGKIKGVRAEPGRSGSTPLSVQRQQLRAPFAQRQRRGSVAEAVARASRRRKEAASASQAAANLKPKDDQAAPPAGVELGIGLPVLALGNCAHSKAWLGLCAGVWSATSRNQANQRRVDGELGTMPELEAVAYDLDAPAVVDRHIQAHGRQSNVTTKAGSGFLADPRNGPLDRNGSGGEDARRGRAAVRRTLLAWLGLQTLFIVNSDLTCTRLAYAKFVCSYLPELPLSPAAAALQPPLRRPSLGPQGQAAVALWGGMVEDAVERRARAGRLGIPVAPHLGAEHNLLFFPRTFLMFASPDGPTPRATCELRAFVQCAAPPQPSTFRKGGKLAVKDDGDVAGARSGCAGRRSAPSPSATSARRVLASSLAAKDCMRVQILEAALAEQLNRRITDENCTALGPKPSGAREDAAATGLGAQFHGRVGNSARKSEGREAAKERLAGRPAVADGL
ncbi:unnamed protein product [Symbiodinium sp. KB8]|nr:unnamed protein product [Symbiodinium sp. KB8]